jgi:hypothetical protein
MKNSVSRMGLLVAAAVSAADRRSESDGYLPAWEIDPGELVKGSRA